MLKLGKRYDALGMFPYLCRMDYLMAHFMGHGFTRTKTLADGDDCCNCGYKIGGSCEWAPEKGFVDRKQVKHSHGCPPTNPLILFYERFGKKYQREKQIGKESEK